MGPVILGTNLLDVAFVPRTFFSDSRGTFRRLYDQRSDAHKVVQISVSTNIHVGTLRGIHSSILSHDEHKIVECIDGKIFDIWPQSC